jgi:hypothetical protein
LAAAAGFARRGHERLVLAQLSGGDGRLDGGHTHFPPLIAADWHKPRAGSAAWTAAIRIFRR